METEKRLRVGVHTTQAFKAFNCTLCGRNLLPSRMCRHVNASRWSGALVHAPDMPAGIMYCHPVFLATVIDSVHAHATLHSLQEADLSNANLTMANLGQVCAVFPRFVQHQNCMIGAVQHRGMRADGRACAIHGAQRGIKMARAACLHYTCSLGAPCAANIRTHVHG